MLLQKKIVTLCTILVTNQVTVKMLQTLGRSIVHALFVLLKVKFFHIYSLIDVHYRIQEVIQQIFLCFSKSRSFRIVRETNRYATQKGAVEWSNVTVEDTKNISWNYSVDGIMSPNKYSQLLVE